MKKYMLPITILFIAGMVTLIMLTKAQNRPDNLDPKTARELLDNYATMMSGINTEKTGLPSAADLKTATLTNPHRVMVVPLDKLKALDSNGSIGAIAAQGATTFYEVRGADGKMLALMEVAAKEGKYMAASFGHRAIADAIAQAGANNPSGDLVRIQALHLDFLSSNTGGAMTYTALQNVPEFGLRQGATFSDKDLLRIVSPFVRSYNGLPL